MDRLFVTDLDGTLLRSDGTLSPYSTEVVAAALRAGVALTYATARSHHTARPILAGLPLRLPAIVYNGAFVVDPETGVPAVSNLLDPGVAAAILRSGGQGGVRPFIMGFARGREVIVHGAPQNRGQAAFLETRRRRRDPRLTHADPLWLPEEVIELHYAAPRDELTDLAASVVREFGDRVTAHLSRDFYTEGCFSLEITDAGASKRSMLLWLAARLGVAPERITVFGDGHNDLPMFEVAGRRVAVANAHPEVRAAADEIVAANDDDGVARYIRDAVLRDPEAPGAPRPSPAGGADNPAPGRDA